MRKHIIFSFLFIALGTSYTPVIAQIEPGQFVLNLGVGESPEFNGDIATIFSPGKMFPIAAYDNAPYLSDDYPPMYNTSSITPNIGVTGDYGFLKWLSIGIAGSYQSETVNWTPADLAFSGQQQSSSFPYIDKVSRLNIAGRFLFHLIRNENLDFYTGFRAGVSYWHDATYTIDTINPTTFIYLKTPAYFIGKSSLMVPSFQYLWGLRIYPSKNIGIHIEAGIGSPYLVEGGVTFRINTRKITPETSTGNATKQATYRGGIQIK